MQQIEIVTGFMRQDGYRCAPGGANASNILDELRQFHRMREVRQAGRHMPKTIERTLLHPDVQVSIRRPLYDSLQ